MTLSAIEHAIRYCGRDDWTRLERVYRFLRQHGPVERNRVMRCCGFPDPKEQPVIAYVEFTNAIDRLNRVVRRHGQHIEGGRETREVYSIEGGR